MQQRAYIQGGMRIILIVSIVALLVYAFLVRGQVGGSTFATNTGQAQLELKIDSTTFYNGVLQPKLTWALKNLVPGVDKFWNFDDVKPGDTGTTSISIHIAQGPAFVCLDFYNFKDFENGINEPESHVDTSSTTGELAEGLEFFAWRDDGDEKFEVGEKPLFGTTSQSASILLNNTTYAIADAMTGTPIPNNVTNYVGIYWCAGDLIVDVGNGTASCNGKALGNEAQTDSMHVDVGIRAVVASAQPTFTCNGVPPPVNWCEFEGHKYDTEGNPLKDWSIGLMKKIKHNKGVDVYDLATTTTDSNGYFCLDWNGESRTLRGTSTYQSGPYTHEYFVYEFLKTGWGNAFIEKGATVPLLTPVPQGQIIKEGQYVSVSMGTGYIQANKAYHVDFYNTITTALAKKGKSSTAETPRGFSKTHGANEVTTTWTKVEEKSVVSKVVEKSKSVLKLLKS